MKSESKKISIPGDLEFSDLRLRRDPRDGSVTFEADVVHRICEANGIDYSQMIGIEDNVAGLVTAWYGHHRASGGDKDPVAEELIEEVLIEEHSGQSFSVPPGEA